MKGNKGSKSKAKYWIIGGSFIAVLCIIGAFALTGYNPLAQTTTSKLSTFDAKAYVDGEDVSGLVPLSLWTPKSTATFSTTEDIYTMTNYQETVASVVTGFISTDLSSFKYVWCQVDPDGDTPFAEDWILLLPNGINKEYTIYPKDPTTDINFNLLDSTTLDEITVTDYQTDGNFTLVYDCPHYTTTAAQMHYGTGWATTTTEFNDLTATQQLWFYDEMNYAGQFGLFDPNDFTYKTTLSHPNLASITNAFCFKIQFNDTVSIVDLSTTQVNFTLSGNVPYETYISGEYIYLIAYNPITFTSGVRHLEFELKFGSWIALSDIDSGNVPIQQSGNALGTFVKLSDIAA